MKLIKIILIIFTIIQISIGQVNLTDNLSSLPMSVKDFHVNTKTLSVKPQGQSESNNLSDGVYSYSPSDFILNSCEFEEWRPTKEFLEMFPYYLSGFNDDGMPIWVAEFGAYDLRTVTSRGKKGIETFDNFTKDLCYNMVKSIFLSPKSGRPAFEFVFIVDFEGFSMEQASLPNFQYIIKLARQYAHLIDEYVHSVIVINVNYVAEMFTNLVRPVFGRIMEKVDIFGTNKNKWLAHIRQNLPRDQIPEWYGGYKDFKPVRVFG